MRTPVVDEPVDRAALLRQMRADGWPATSLTLTRAEREAWGEDVRTEREPTAFVPPVPHPAQCSCRPCEGVRELHRRRTGFDRYGGKLDPSPVVVDERPRSSPVGRQPLLPLLPPRR